MFRLRFIIALIAILSGICLFAQDFKTQHLKNGRVKQAYNKKSRMIIDLLEFKDLDINTLEICIRIFKHEKQLEIWGRDSLHDTFMLISAFHICRISGKAGPKRKQGDGQIPEGFYHIDRFNPWSSFHLSLGINYPNASDRVLSDRNRPGGDIFIHGSCVTIGCLPMTDERMEEIYLIVMEAANNGQKQIPVHIFPMRMHGDPYNALLQNHRDNGALIEFWSNIEEGYLFFKENKTKTVFEVDSDGKYCFR